MTEGTQAQADGRAFVVPPHFNKNDAKVVAAGTPTQTGSALLDYMAERIGLTDLSACDVLDFGCGSRFAEAIANGYPIRSYLGIDVDREMVDWINANVADPRVTLCWWNARNPNYNPEGEPLSEETALPVDGRSFDIACMFSVITHQLPEDALIIFRLLRKHVRPRGHLFFSANIQEMAEDYRELAPVPTGHSAYSLAALERLLGQSGWRVLSVAPKRPKPGVWAQDTVLCA